MKEKSKLQLFKNSLPSVGMLLLTLVFSSFQLKAQTTVRSISALMPYLNDNNANVKLAPGTYRIGPDDVSSGLLSSNPLFEFTGTNSTYDFTGVTIEVETEIFQSFGNVQVIEFYVLGRNNLLKNLKIVDIGNARPTRSALSMTLDGVDNTVEGFDIRTSGSYPYGYGDMFGKAGTGNIIKHYKHSAIRVSGDRPHLKDLNLIHRAYGHAVAFQGSVDALIEGCYIEGEMRTTDAVLAERGTAADDVNFMTYWGYRLPSGYTFSTGEDGIRAYNSGTYFATGESRRTTNITVRNCTVKNMRGAFPLALIAGDRNLTNCTAIGCESAFSIGSGGNIVNGKADAKYGPVFVTTYQQNSGTTADITILNSDNRYGRHPVAYIAAANHDITLRSEDSSAEQGYYIQVGGTKEGLRFYDGYASNQNGHTSSGVELNNLTGFPVLLDSSCSNADVTSCGSVTNRGSGNSVSRTNCNFDDNEEEIEIGGDFTPDPNKTYYLDVPVHNVRLAANGSSEEPYTVSTGNTGDNVKWKFVKAGDLWFIRRAAGGNRPGLRTDNSENADMQETTNTGGWTKYAITNGASSGTYYLTLPGGPSSYRRLQVDRALDVKMVADNRNGTWESFRITEAGSSNGGTTTTDCDLPYSRSDFEVTNRLVNHTSSPIDISCAGSVTISMDLTSVTRMETADYLNIYYRVDNGAWQVFSENVDSFADKTVTKSGISGNTLSLRYLSLTNVDEETYGVYNIQVTSGSAKSLSLDTNAITLYPNPVIETATLTGAANANLTIYTMSGAVVSQGIISSGSETINLNGLAAGVYYAAINGNGTQKIIKLIKK